MYIKWIVCQVKDGLKQEFSDAQEQWILTQHSKGFIGQIGGWDLQNEHSACILSFWKDKDSLDAFMTNVHDNIFFDNNQADYYQSIQVDYYYTELDITELSLKKELRNAKFLQVEKLDRRQVERKFWLNGKLDNPFLTDENIDFQYLGMSLWDVPKKLDGLNQWSILLVDVWTVLRLP